MFRMFKNQEFRVQGHPGGELWPEGTSEGTLLGSPGLLPVTTLIYAIGAGITAAAGTRLALQLFLVKGFKVYSFRLPGLG